MVLKMGKKNLNLNNGLMADVFITALEWSHQLKTQHLIVNENSTSSSQ